MVRKEVSPFEFFEETDSLMRSGGLLLVSSGKDGKPNAMTIGWGLVGTMWRLPVFCVAVRLSRYTHKLIDETGRFTVCLPSKNMDEVLDVCGTKSGRDMDKLKELGLTAKKGKVVDVPYIEECPIHYECEVIYKTVLEPGQLKKAVEGDVYPTGNYHTMYYGHIKGVYAEEGAHGNLL